MNPSPEQLKQILSDADHPLGVKELLRLAGLHPGQQTALKRALRELVRRAPKTPWRVQVERQGGSLRVSAAQ